MHQILLTAWGDHAEAVSIHDTTAPVLAAVLGVWVLVALAVWLGSSVLSRHYESPCHPTVAPHFPRLCARALTGRRECDHPDHTWKPIHRYQRSTEDVLANVDQILANEPRTTDSRHDTRYVA